MYNTVNECDLLTLTPPKIIISVSPEQQHLTVMVVVAADSDEADGAEESAKTVGERKVEGC